MATVTRGVREFDNASPETKRPGGIGPGIGTRVQSLITLANELRAQLVLWQNVVLTPPGLAIGSSSKKAVKVANAVNYLESGTPKLKAGAEVAFTATTHDIAVHATLVQERVFLVTISGSGVYTLTAGTIATGAGVAVAPAIPTGHHKLGTVRIAVAGGVVPFDATTDDLDAVHLTVTYTDATEPPAAVLAAPAVASLI